MRESGSLEDLHPHEVAQRQRGVLVAALRSIFLAAFIIVAILAILGGEGAGERIPLVEGWYLILGFAVVLAMVTALIDWLTPNKKISTIASVFFGIMVAMLATFVAGQFIDLIASLYDIQYAQLISTAKILVGIALAYLGVVTVLQTQDDFRLVIPYVEFAKQIRGTRPYLLDTSALIDARILDIGETGLIQAPLVIPEFVVRELQALADSKDRLKRERGRRGLEVIGKLQRSPSLDVTIDDTPVAGKAVDQMLVSLASTMPAVIITTDHGLTRVARIQGARVLNLNDLASAMKPSLVQGERFRIRLVKPGEQKGQGVGYLEDGTMVVAEDGEKAIGRTVTLTVTNIVQTSAGRLIFGRIDEGTGDDDEQDERTQRGVNDDAPPAPQRDGEARRGRTTDESPALERPQTQRGGTERPPGERPRSARNPRR